MQAPVHSVMQPGRQSPSRSAVSLLVPALTCWQPSSHMLSHSELHSCPLPLAAEFPDPLP
eukprot:768716-Hanusia_phi.AAC.3